MYNSRPGSRGKVSLRDQPNKDNTYDLQDLSNVLDSVLPDTADQQSLSGFGPEYSSDFDLVDDGLVERLLSEFPAGEARKRSEAECYGEAEGGAVGGWDPQQDQGLAASLTSTSSEVDCLPLGTTESNSLLSGGGPGWSSSAGVTPASHSSIYLSGLQCTSYHPGELSGASQNPSGTEYYTSYQSGDPSGASSSTYYASCELTATGKTTAPHYLGGPSATSYSQPSGDLSTGPSGTGRKGYKHRHRRQFTDNVEEKKQRNTKLNNEASKIYRQKLKQGLKSLEGELRQQEERNQQLTPEYQRLKLMYHKAQEIYKKYISYQNPRNPSQ